MDLQTKVEINKPDFMIDYDSKIMLIGSCFVENMGKKLDYFRFHADVNPCGIVYNPSSVANTLELLLDQKIFTEKDLIWNEGKWISLCHHGSFSSSDKTLCLEGINQRIKASADYLANCDLLVITFGTSWVFRYRPDGRIVSNCHKIPASSFERSRLNVAGVADEYTLLVSRLRKLNPRLKILFTVSPIRHWKDGAHGNQLSKSVLFLAIDELMGRLENVYYFPSYEIQMDELRDYRFYAEDMLHVSSLATDYIWERFKDIYIPEKYGTLMKRIDKVNKMKNHRPIETTGEEYEKFQARIDEEEKELKKLIS